ncbi:MAG: hypothetical protein JXA22_10150 [Candidatus Thermoplasmatota archaeon]|nr:hypothetical protein [Candidatus Thermoplasmatota archaeon]
MSSIRSILLSTFLFSVLFVAGVTAEGPAEGPNQSIDLVRMEIEEERIGVDISFNGTSTGQLHCRATLVYDLGLLIEYVDLHIEPDFPDEHVSVVLEEYDIRLTPDSPVYEFMANITVLPRTSASLNPSVVMDGTARTNRGTEGEVMEDSAEIDVLPYYSATIYFKDPTGSLDTGSSGTFELTVQNTGNSGEHFILSVVNSGSLVEKGIEVQMIESRVYVEENGEKQVDVKISADSRTDRGSYVIMIAVWSERNGHPVEEDNEASLTMNVDKAYIDIVERFIKDPIYLWIGLGIFIMVVFLAVWGSMKLREHILWKRTLDNIKKANTPDDPYGSEGPIEGEAR